MGRPISKSQLLELSENNFNTLFSYINTMTDKEVNGIFSFDDRDKNVRDVLVHLYEWHMLLLNWVNSNIHGNGSSFLPYPYNWKTYPQMNIEFWKKHQSTTVEEAILLLKSSHSDVMTTITTFTDEELFIKKHFTWTGTTNLGSYCISATSSHYDWAVKKLKKYKKELQES